MTVIVSFATTKGIGSVTAPGIGSVRSREDLTAPASTTGVAHDGEIAIVANGEASMVAVAFGITPDAAATSSTGATTAGFGVAAGSVVMIPVKAGDKINVKAIS